MGMGLHLVRAELASLDQVGGHRMVLRELHEAAGAKAVETGVADADEDRTEVRRESERDERRAHGRVGRALGALLPDGMVRRLAGTEEAGCGPVAPERLVEHLEGLPARHLAVAEAPKAACNRPEVLGNKRVVLVGLTTTCLGG